MSRRRLLAALALAIVVLALAAWQIRRERLMRACADDQGLWDGAACKPDERRLRIQRDLHRVGSEVRPATARG